MNAFEAVSLSRTYFTEAGRRVCALDRLSVSSGDARLIALIGPDGAGKSTFMKLLCGLEKPDEGTVSVLGMEPAPERPAFSSAISYMPQKFGLYADLTCLENLMLFARLRGVEGDLAEVAGRLLSMTGLSQFGSRLAGKLSGGMKQKLGLACALVKTPRLLILDEPTVGVDPLSRRELWAVVREMLEETGVTCFFSTAYLEEAGAAERVIFLQDGRIAGDGPVQGFVGRAKGRSFSLPLEGLPAEEAKALSRRLMREVSAEVPGSPLLDAVPRDGHVNLLCSGGGVPPAGAIPRAPSLEDAYAALTLGGEAGAGAAPSPAAPSGVPAEPGGDDAVISARAVRRTFGDFVAVAETSFDVRRGEIFGLLGPNGAGKTTTFRMLCGLLAPSSGTVRVAGFDIRSAKSEVRSRIGYVAQRFSLYEKLTVRQNLMYFGRSYGLSGAALRGRVAEMLAAYGLADVAGRFARDLPEGARRSLSMACALLHRPEILFLDEATSGADLAARRSFWRQIVSLAEAGTTVVVTTHFMEEAEYCDRFLIQDAGRVLAIGTPSEIRAGARGDGRPAGSVEEAFVAIVERFRRGGSP